MTAVRPRELANAVAVFGSARAARLSCEQFHLLVKRGLSLDCTASPFEITEACLQCGLISQSNDDYVLTERGRELSKKQGEANPSLSEAAQRFMLRELYLNLDAGEICCADFLLLMQVDTAWRTFSFERNPRDTPEILASLMTLTAVGLLETFPDRALVVPAHLGLVNECLRKLRGVGAPAEEATRDELNEVGDLAEQRAVEHERARLVRAGHPELAQLVKRISTIDTTAGYDVESFRGAGSPPDAQIFIEVKGTRRPTVSFVWSRNERAVASIKRGAYWLYAYTNVDIRAGTAEGPVRINNPVSRLESLGFSVRALDVYVCRLPQSPGKGTGVKSRTRPPGRVA